MRPFRRLRLLAELFGAAEGVDDARLELAAAAARRALAPTVAGEDTPAGSIAGMGAAIYARIPCVVVITCRTEEGAEFDVRLAYDGADLGVEVSREAAPGAGLRGPWPGILAALREAMGSRGETMPTAKLDVLRDTVESWSFSGTCRGDHVGPPCKDPACRLAQGIDAGN